MIKFPEDGRDREGEKIETLELCIAGTTGRIIELNRVRI